MILGGLIRSLRLEISYYFDTIEKLKKGTMKEQIIVTPESTLIWKRNPIELIESGIGKNMFTNPQEEKTKNYIEGRFG